MNSKREMVTVSGLATARGLASGPVFLYRGAGDIPIPEYVVEFGHENEELTRLAHARSEVKRDLENLISVLRERTGRSDVMVFECHLMILEDPALTEETNRSVTLGHLNAEAAIHKTAQAARAKFERMNDPYFRERVRDLDDIERRILKVLTGFSGCSRLDLKRPSVIVADDLTPSETVQIPRDLVLGFATNGGSTTSHVALLARAMGIPAVTGLGDITSRVTPDTMVLLDGNSGTVTVDPDFATRREFDLLVERQRRASMNDAGVPAGTLKDGTELRVYANIHPGIPTDGIKELGARGVGLYRSEYLWLNGESQPSEEEQFVAYRDAVTFAMTLSPAATIVIRTLDIGGDKVVKGISSKEANPFLGNRSIRYLLSHRETMRTQLRAILRASAFGRLGVMYPMVSCVEELRQAAAILEEVKRKLDDEGLPYDREMPVGVMIEVPAAALNAEAFAKYVDFFSIGTNDLVQYTMAADRANESVAYLYQPLNPAILRLMRMTIAAAKKQGIYVGVCGESASDPIIGVLWAAMGIDALSMSATYIPVIAKILRCLTREDLDEYAALVDGIDPGSTGEEIFAACRAWLAKKVPDLDDLLL